MSTTATRTHTHIDFVRTRQHYWLLAAMLPSSEQPQIELGGMCCHLAEHI